LSCPPREPGEQQRQTLSISTRSLPGLAWRSSFRSPAPCLRSMVLTLTVLPVCSRQQRERAWDESAPLPPPLLQWQWKVWHGRGWRLEQQRAYMDGWSSKAVHQIETEWKRTATSTSPEYVLVDRRETCGPHHVSKANSLCCIHIHTYVSGGTEFVSTATFRFCW
jgi:hypothetical protein